ncbi:hypothetical protein GCM10023324_24450 [Streptomyces youssoufiensis]
MSTPSNHSSDPQPHGTPPNEPETPAQTPSGHRRAGNVRAWAAAGLSAALLVAGATFSLAGYETAGDIFISTGGALLRGGLRTRK